MLHNANAVPVGSAPDRLARLIDATLDRAAPASPNRQVSARTEEKERAGLPAGLGEGPAGLLGSSPADVRCLAGVAGGESRASGVPAGPSANPRVRRESCPAVQATFPIPSEGTFFPNEGGEEGEGAGRTEGGDRDPYRYPSESAETPQNRPLRAALAENGRGAKSKNAPAQARPAARSASNGRAYIQQRAKVPAVAAGYVDSLLRDYDDVTAHFFKHVLSSGCLWTYEDRRVPVPFELIHRTLRRQAVGPSGAFVDVLPDVAGLVRARLMDSPTDVTRGRCAEYRVCDAVQDEYDRLTEAHLEGPFVNLYTGRRDRSYVKCDVEDAEGRAVPELVRDAMRAVEPNGYADFTAACAELSRQRADVRACRVAEATVASEYGRGSDEHDDAGRVAQRAEARYRNDLHCLRAIRANKTADVTGPAGEDTGVIRYRVPYRMTSTGRLAFVGGGAQSCSGRMKAALYIGVGAAVGRPLFNYDIRSSQPTILREKLKEARLSTEWIDAYTAGEKADYAERAGLTVPTWKTVLCAVMMSATLPRLSRAERSRGDVVRAVRDETGRRAFLPVFASLRGVLDPLYGVIQDWHTYLTTDWLRANGYRDRGKEYVKNPTGARFCVSDHVGAGRSPHKLRAKLAAFVLQGQEAYFVHALTLLGEKYGFTVLANEHDGLVTLGEIPPAAIAEAQAACSMPYADLIPKAFL